MKTIGPKLTEELYLHPLTGVWCGLRTTTNGTHPRQYIVAIRWPNSAGVDVYRFDRITDWRAKVATVRAQWKSEGYERTDP